MDKLPRALCRIAAVLVSLLIAACATRGAQPINVASNDLTMSDAITITPRGTTGMVTLPPAPPAMWHCFENDVSPGLDNACGLSEAECKKQLRSHSQNAEQRGIQFHSERGCMPIVERPFCFWVELDAERIGYVCRQTQMACERSAEATTHPLVSDCAQAPRTGLAYAGSR